jgi:uncharacterized membrane protein (TIGR02234 family)
VTTSVGTRAGQPPSGQPRSGQHRSARRTLTLTMLLGVAGAGLAFLATRQGWAQVRTAPPRPLPPSLVGVTGAALVPYSDALIVAGLASQAAVLATRRAWRRLSGATLAVLGAGLAASAFTVSAAGAIAAAAASVGPASNPGAGSVTQGSAGAATVPDVVGAAAHVAFTAAGWQAVEVAGALVMIAVGVFAAWRPASLAVMSSKYEAPPGATRPGAPSRPGPAAQPGPAGRPEPAGQPADSASMWEALSRGDDPTASGRQAAGA